MVLGDAVSALEQFVWFVFAIPAFLLSVISSFFDQNKERGLPLDSPLQIFFSQGNKFLFVSFRESAIIVSRNDLHSLRLLCPM